MSAAGVPAHRAENEVAEWFARGTRRLTVVSTAGSNVRRIEASTPEGACVGWVDLAADATPDETVARFVEALRALAPGEEVGIGFARRVRAAYPKEAN